MSKQKKLIFSSKDDDEVLIEKINLLIDEEYKKKDSEMDLDLLDECFTFLDELTDDDTLSSEECIRKIKERISAEEKILKPKCKIKMRVILVAAILSALVASLAICTGAFDQTWENLEKLFDEGKGFTDSNGDDYGIFDSDVKIYPSIEELVEAENISFLYPSKLPEGCVIERWECYFNNGVKNIFPFLNESKIDYLFLISLKEESIDDYIHYGEKLTVNGITVCAIQNEKGYHARFIFDGKTYTLRAPDHDALMYILENLKEIGND